MKYLTIVASLFLAQSTFAGSKAILNVAPYIQQATPTSISISWETSIGDHSRVYWGETSNLGSKAEGSAITGYATTEIHTVDLENLKPDTTYYYQINSLLVTTQVYSFRTPPKRDSEKSFRFALYSDNQQQSNIHKQVIQGIQKRAGITSSDQIPNELAFTLVAGDIVQEGNLYWQYMTRFFTPAQSLTPYIPFYVSIGNHEEDSSYYFNYFNFPKNGTPGFLEHWYSFDYSNTHIIALDTNVGYRLQSQLTWLENDLKSACLDSNTDFIFTFFHHPHHSEMWVDGDTQYSEEIINIVEKELLSCGKQGALFFGHTHGYSRGQRKDSPLYLVNVASAGGHLDTWGDWPIQDLDEFQTSIDEYGYLLVDVQAGQDPSFKLTRYTLGDDNGFIDNQIQDTFGIKKNNSSPELPNATNMISIRGTQIFNTFDAGRFVDTDLDSHIETEWKIVDSTSGKTLLQSWDRYENLYFDKLTTQSLTQLEFDEDSAEIQYCRSTQCYFQVRFRDSNLNWSAWSDQIEF